MCSFKKEIKMETSKIKAKKGVVSKTKNGYAKKSSQAVCKNGFQSFQKVYDFGKIRSRKQLLW